MTDKVETWIDRHLGEVVKIAIIVFGVIYGYIQIQSDVENLKAIRVSDKEGITRSIDELKYEVRELRNVLIQVIKENKQQ